MSSLYLHIARHASVVTGVEWHTYIIPQGVSSVHVLPTAAAISFVNSEPRTKSQKNLEKKQLQKAAKTTSGDILADAMS